MIQMVVFNILEDINGMSPVNDLFAFWKNSFEVLFILFY